MEPNSTLDMLVAQEGSEGEDSLAERVLFKQTVSGFRYQQREVKAEFLIEKEEENLLFSLFLRYEDNDAPLVMKQGKEVNFASIPAILFSYEELHVYVKQQRLSVIVPKKFGEVSRRQDQTTREREELYTKKGKIKHQNRLRQLSQQIARYNSVLNGMYIQAIAEQYGRGIAESYGEKISLFLSKQGTGSIGEIIRTPFASTSPYCNSSYAAPIRGYSRRMR